MAILIFVLSLVLLAAGAVGAVASLDLLPDPLGVLYALAGAVGVAAAMVTFAIGVAVRRIDALAKLVRQSTAPAVGDMAEEGPQTMFVAGPKIEPARVEEPVRAALSAGAEAREDGDEADEAEDESPVNINRTGHLPSLEAIESVLETPETPPSMIGSYSSAGANYKIFADGSIEAETNEGTFKFASMSDFKRHLADAKAKATDEVE